MCRGLFLFLWCFFTMTSVVSGQGTKDFKGANTIIIKTTKSVKESYMEMINLLKQEGFTMRQTSEEYDKLTTNNKSIKFFSMSISCSFSKEDFTTIVMQGHTIIYSFTNEYMHLARNKGGGRDARKLGYNEMKRLAFLFPGAETIMFEYR